MDGAENHDHSLRITSLCPDDASLHQLKCPVFTRTLAAPAVFWVRLLCISFPDAVSAAEVDLCWFVRFSWVVAPARIDTHLGCHFVFWVNVRQFLTAVAAG